MVHCLVMTPNLLPNRNAKESNTSNIQNHTDNSRKLNAQTHTHTENTLEALVESIECVKSIELLLSELVAQVFRNKCVLSVEFPIFIVSMVFYLTCTISIRVDGDSSELC